MSKEWKVGDKLKVVDEPTLAALAKGTIVVVAGFPDQGRVEVADRAGNIIGQNGNGWFTNRFERLEPNGVNHEGKPLFFDVEDLKPNQRVKLENGKMAIVTDKKELVFREKSVDWDTYYSSCRFEGCSDRYNIVAVFESPIAAYRFLNPNYFGQTIWEKKDVAAITAADEAVEAAKKRAQEAADALAEAIKQRAALN